MGEKVDEAVSIDERQIMQNSGKLLILGILSLAILLAGVSWWFRYEATHRAAQFWGPEASRLIRDAGACELIVLRDTDQTGIGDAAGETVIVGSKRWSVDSSRSIRQARGLTHLRNALLEDHSFTWPSQADVPDVPWRWGLKFADPPSSQVTIWISSDCRWAVKDTGRDDLPSVVCCEPIAKGLAEMSAELSAVRPPAR